MKNKLLPLLALILGLVLTAATPAPASAQGAAPEQPLRQVLALGPLPVDPALLADNSKRPVLQRSLVQQLASRGLPQAGERVAIFGQDLAWQTLDPARAPAGPGLWLWTAQLETDRHVSGKLALNGLEQPSAWIEEVARAVSDSALDLELATGSHRLWLVHQGRSDGARAALTWRGKQGHDRIQSHVQPWRRVSARQLTNAMTVQRQALSADGRLLALALRGRDDYAGIDIQRLEIRRLPGGRVIEQWQDSIPSRLAFSPDGRWLASQQGKNLWLRNLDSGDSRLLLADYEHLGVWHWHPDSGSILFQWRQPWDSKGALVRRLRGLEDRWRTFRDNSQLYQADIGSGLVRPLTNDAVSVNLLDIHPDGDRILLSQRELDYAEPPHSQFRLQELSLADGSRRDIARLRQINGARFADDGYWLLAGPNLSPGDGNALPDETAANDYDGQLYLLSADGQHATSMSRAFVPAIGGLERLDGGDLLLPVTEGDRALLYRFHVADRHFERIDTGVDILEGFVASRGASATLAVHGTDADRPQRVHIVDLAGNSNQVLLDSAQTHYRQTRLGEVRDWRFDNRHGDQIDGRYYLPPDFDPDQRYPLIVYYYGGTTPVNRQFTGRYPFHLWAANGYVIYVLQPRGTVGYGQETSALHVNAWGKHAADDIIDGTRAFLTAHPFIDSKRVGNIGASYGGFMTMYLATLTDQFAASVSHAGISNLSGYWGQGWWGYGYSGVASRGSFPWNNRELYVEHSPVYNADRITTPLLLLTGDADTNVPPGESHTMYTALKLLGREVELVEVPGEDHHILDREKRYRWWDTIQAWFDLHLKDQPQWWQALYPETVADAEATDG